MAEWSKRVRSVYEQGEYQPYFQVSIGGTPLFHESTTGAWLNGVEYHQDAEKAVLVERLERELGTNVALGIFVSQLSGRIKATRRLANVVQLILDHGKCEMAGGGAI